MTVFVVHPVNDDLTQAKKFGEFRYINERYVYGDELERSIAPEAAEIAPTAPIDWIMPRNFSSNLRAAVSDFNAHNDFVLIAGDHLQLVSFIAALTEKWEFFRVLRYDRKISDYIPVRIDYLADRSTPVLKSTHIGDRPDAQAGSQEDHVTREFRIRQAVLDESGLATPDRTGRKRS